MTLFGNFEWNLEIPKIEHVNDWRFINLDKKA